MSQTDPDQPSTRTRAVGAGLSAVGASAGAAGLGYAGYKVGQEAKKLPKTLGLGRRLVRAAGKEKFGAALVPLEVAGLGGEVMATHILHSDVKQKQQQQGATVNKSAAGQSGRRIVEGQDPPAPVEIDKALLGKLVKPAVKAAEAAPKPKSLAQMRDEARGSLSAALESKGSTFTPVKKARRFDPEADRQRRLGTYAGLAGGGAVVAAHEAGRRVSFERVPGEVGGTRKLGFKPRKGKAGLLASGAALGLAGLAGHTYRRGVSERNQPWT